MPANEKTHGLVKLDAEGVLVCFCSYDEYLRGDCTYCQRRNDCPEAMIEIMVIPGTRPSEQDLEPLKKAERAAKKVAKNLNSIKKGVSRLERDMKKLPIK